jgi:hypothetical protein
MRHRPGEEHPRIRMILTELGRKFTMTPAVCFVSTTGNDKDPYDLVGRVKSKPQLEEMGAEQLSNSAPSLYLPWRLHRSRCQPGRAR